MAIFINLLDKKDLWALPPGRHSDGLGLSLLVGKDAPKGGGARSWALQGGRGLGSLRKVNLIQARQRRDIMLGQAAQTPDEPLPVAPVLKVVPTFLERAKEVIAVQTDGAKSPRAAYQWERSLLHFAKPLHDMKVDTVITDDVTKVLAPIWVKKAPTARQVRKHIAKVFSSCKADRLIEWNPAALEDNLEHKLKKHKHKTRHHPAMPHADVPAYLMMLEAEGTLSALALAFAILTCVRSEEAFAARWCDIDSDNVWTHDAKNGLFSRVPLTPKALAILDKVKAFVAKTGERGDSATYIFPGKQDGHLSRHAMLKTLKATHRHLSVHGFRGSFKSWGMKFKIDRDTIEYCLHHIEGSRTEQAYMGEECLENRREVLEQWAAYCTPKPALRLVA